MRVRVCVSVCMCDLPYTNLPVNQSFNQKTDEAANNDRETLTERERGRRVERSHLSERRGRRERRRGRQPRADEEPQRLNYDVHFLSIN